ncbi:hypothetical protein [Saccharophagus degradans]|uniref:Co-chaperone DjlA N-terminal domain-containing protein n=2 Tax=Saccharophagus degradans TaxID=86304 RepID=A0AAW7X745_9GAMM|nr:hypothetical protein [Saccharophagus degradans]ABD79279.1 hypothetical extracellular protein [Saccharophagus degradans 2-40]MDO6422692.1 hypothetical protein [Saccharophagus degradans]MDO6609613.1 hypothetical protein [Saccharophagus degradans]
MHILIGLITAIAGLVWALHSLQNAGVNLNGFNPFYWMRRRKWEKSLGTKPIHRLTDPMEAAALLVTAVALKEGELSRDAKADLINLFATEFRITTDQATELYGASCYLLKDVMDIDAEVKAVLSPSIEQFQSHHKTSFLSMLNSAANFEGQPNANQKVLIEKIIAQIEGPVDGKSW